MVCMTPAEVRPALLLSSQTPHALSVWVYMTELRDSSSCY